MPLELSSKAEEVGYINGLLSQLDRQIQQILADRVSLLRQLNYMQSSDSILPDEILSTIFVIAHEEPYNAVSPIILGAVCSRWRRIAWDTPPLWSTIGPIPLRPIRQLDVEMLRLYFRNTAQRPVLLDLCIDCLPPRRRDTKDFFAVIFVENPMRVQKLTLSTTNSSATLAMIKRAIECSNLSSLSTLSFVARTKESMPPIPPLLTNLSHSAINLRTLMVNSYQLPSIEQISRSPITVLKLLNIPINQCLNALSFCPALTGFYCHETRPADAGIESLAHSLKELRTLEIFDVELARGGHSNPIWESFLVVHFRFPNLKHMVWGTLAETPGHGFTSFIGAMKSLLTFKCKFLDNEGILVRIFQSLSSTVRTVYLPRLSYVPEICLQLLKLITNAIVPSSHGMRTLELVFPYYHRTVFTLDLSAIKEDLRKIGVNLEISKAFR